ncbi:MAG: hypothetical protein AB7G08_27755 [Hyphomicrobiaceae bacterium]
MPKPQKPKDHHHQDRMPTEPGFEKRLGGMYKKVLHTPPPRKRGEPPKKAPR